MADTSDVETELVDLISAVVYPNGTGQPSIVNATVGIERGWPTANDLDTELGAGQAIVSVFPPPGMERNTTRWPREEQLLTPPLHTLTAGIVGNVVTLGGTVAVPQNVIVICNQVLFAYGVKASDTLGSIASILAGLIDGQFPGSSASGDAVTIAGHPGIAQARIASSGQIYVEQSRQEKSYWITCWCPTPAMRDVLAPAIDVALKQLDFITVGPEQSEARIRYVNSNVSDEGQKVQIYRRDLVYWVEYGTGTISTAFETGAIELLGIVPPLPPPPPGGGLSLDFSDPDNLVLNVSL